VLEALNKEHRSNENSAPLQEDMDLHVTPTPRDVNRLLEYNKGSALECFRVLFDCNTSPERRIWLHNLLETTDIRQREFLDSCMKQAHSRLKEMKLKFGFDRGGTTIRDVVDTDLIDVRADLERVWPFVSIYGRQRVSLRRAILRPDYT
jgi:hypothetical protein